MSFLSSSDNWKAGPVLMDFSPVPISLAPMAGVTDLAYRLLARECGADYWGA